MLLTVISKLDVTPTSLVFQGKTLPFQTCPSEIGHSAEGLSCHFTLVSIPIDITPGSHNLTIDLSRAGLTEKITVPLQIVSKQYPEEHLTVEPKMVEFPPEILTRIKEEQTALITSMNHETNCMYWTPWFVWPVPEEIKSPFGLRRFFNGQPRSPHAGIDLKGGIGDPVRASNNGRIVFLRDCYLSGNTMVIDHGYGLYSIYCHLSKIYVSLDEEVKKNQIIGEVGKTGRTTGPHLHWGISLHGIRIDPQSLMRLLGERNPFATGTDITPSKP
ncbi:MAG: M23 family metallopeptidase [Dissulfuribacterales bacterium]